MRAPRHPRPPRSPGRQGRSRGRGPRHFAFHPQRQVGWGSTRIWRHSHAFRLRCGARETLSRASRSPACRSASQAPATPRGAGAIRPQFLYGSNRDTTALPSSPSTNNRELTAAGHQGEASRCRATRHRPERAYLLRQSGRRQSYRLPHQRRHGCINAGRLNRESADACREDARE